ncbi:hypothetical protein [Clostridium guangxiense]|uniref:hypothetical protein n=1 Tax=Clostridium guangxiense TaxID=1662055 RepID=UPI001E36CB4D|nr:hypothetical protein [Clostridium guangxiense]MCD2345571.1 hypothetical protein [Clostridium guangxiense]
MHDTILLSKISQGLAECCKRGKITKVNKMAVIVNKDSHVNSNNLFEYLRSYNDGLIDACTEIKIEIGDLPDETAIIRNIEGDLAEG